jgi:hypothetical protein
MEASLGNGSPGASRPSAGERPCPHCFWVQSPMAAQVKSWSRGVTSARRESGGRVVPGGQVRQAMSGRQLGTSTSE